MGDNVAGDCLPDQECSEQRVALKRYSDRKTILAEKKTSQAA